MAHYCTVLVEGGNDIQGDKLIKEITRNEVVRHFIFEGLSKCFVHLWFNDALTRSCRRRTARAKTI